MEFRFHFSDLLGIWRKIFGDPIWTEDFDGEVRKSRLKRTSDGIIMVKGICEWRRARRANPDGTIDEGYICKWWAQ